MGCGSCDESEITLQKVTFFPVEGLEAPLKFISLRQLVALNVCIATPISSCVGWKHESNRIFDYFAFAGLSIAVTQVCANCTFR